MGIIKYFAYMFAIGALFDSVTTMLGTASVLSGNSIQDGNFSSLGDKKLFIIISSFVFALLITIIVASSEFLLSELNNNVFKKYIVLPTVMSAFFYDFYTSILGVKTFIMDSGETANPGETILL